ncbi:MAG: hypothetical protein ACI4VH_06720 [Clostridia bacterium]
MEKIPESQINTNKTLEEHQFIANCLQIGLTIDDLKQLQYKDVAKIMLCLTKKEDVEEKQASQTDIDKFLM